MLCQCRLSGGNKCTPQVQVLICACVGLWGIGEISVFSLLSFAVNLILLKKFVLKEGEQILNSDKITSDNIT